MQEASLYSNYLKFASAARTGGLEKIRILIQYASLILNLLIEIQTDLYVVADTSSYIQKTSSKTR